MSSLAVCCDSISKRYQIGQLQNDHPTLRDSLNGLASKLLDRIRLGRPAGVKEEFWALRNVSFDVQSGEIIGIIGNNGAGKSTLLKILSRITKPSGGTVIMHGRVASLLEVGTGFHLELTGRENVFLNGAILGMRRAEIVRKFDEIVAFAEVARFIDTPVKHYSSGMYLRLAFAVAAHLDPEILLVDEVLAVGDASFQKKCLGKMNDVARQGRTVIFVSHNLGAVQALCSRAILISRGILGGDGTAVDIVGKYLESLYENSATSVAERVDRKGQGLVRLTAIGVSAGGDAGAVPLASGKAARFVFTLSEARAALGCSFTIYDQLGQAVTWFDTAARGSEDNCDVPVAGEFVCEIDELLLAPGRYHINVGITWNGQMQDHLEGAAFINVAEGTVRGRRVTTETGYGSVHVPHRWCAKG